MMFWKTGVPLFAATLLSSQALAQTTKMGGNAFAGPPTTDWAAEFINFLFRADALSASLPFSGARLAPVAEAIRGGLGVYSLSILVFAALLLFYHLAAMVAETAHQGVVMGRRTNQIWAPIRLVIAIGLLMPIGSGLSSGQYIVVKIASSGSEIASRAWQGMVGPLSRNFFSLVKPQGPDITRFIVASLEMETCRNIYEQIRAVQPADSGVRFAGSMLALQKIAASGFVPETWRYTNSLNALSPMCGEYRFSGHRPYNLDGSVLGEGATKSPDDIASFSRTEAEAALTRVRGLTLSAAMALAAKGQGAAPDTRVELTELRQAVQQEIDASLLKLSESQAFLTERYLEQTNDSGWLSAAFFIPTLVRLQESYGEIVDHMLPEAQEPVFVHRLLTQQVLMDVLATDPAYRGLEKDTVDGLSRFYGSVSRANANVHAWNYSDQMSSGNILSGSGFDLRDQITAATDSSAAYAYFAQAIDTAALTRGVWGGKAGGRDRGAFFAASSLKDAFNPLASLIEFGRRQFNMGTALIGTASSGLSLPQILAPAILVLAVGALFVIGGLSLVFLVPLLAFARFLFAVLLWFVELFEALIAMPLVALAHLTRAGDGLSGDVARQAYLLWIALAIRPVLSVFGFVVGAVIFAIGIFLLFAAYLPLAQMVISATGGMAIVANTGFILTFDVIACIVAHAAFKGITRLPDQALRWISPFVVTNGALQEGASSQSGTSIISGSVPSSGAVWEQKTVFGSGSVGQSGGGLQGNVSMSSAKSASAVSSLFPLYHDEKKTDASPQKDTNQGNPSGVIAPAPSSPTVNVATTVQVFRDKDKEKKKDNKKDKDNPFDEGAIPQDKNKPDKTE